MLADSLSRPHQLPHTEWSLHPEVFQSLSRQWPVQIDLFVTSDNRRCSIYFSPFRDPMASFNVGTVFRPTHFLRGPSFHECWRHSGCLRGRSSPWWLRIGFSEPGLPTFFSCHWPLRLLFLFVQTSCACLSLTAFTRVSTGYAFMPGDSQALHESCRILILGSLSGFLVA